MKVCESAHPRLVTKTKLQKQGNVSIDSKMFKYYFCAVKLKHTVFFWICGVAKSLLLKRPRVFTAAFGNTVRPSGAGEFFYSFKGGLNIIYVL